MSNSSSMEIMSQSNESLTQQTVQMVMDQDSKVEISDGAGMQDLYPKTPPRRKKDGIHNVTPRKQTPSPPSGEKIVVDALKKKRKKQQKSENKFKVNNTMNVQEDKIINNDENDEWTTKFMKHKLGVNNWIIDNIDTKFIKYWKSNKDSMKEVCCIVIIICCHYLLSFCII